MVNRTTEETSQQNNDNGTESHGKLERISYPGPFTGPSCKIRKSSHNLVKRITENRLYQGAVGIGRSHERRTSRSVSDWSSKRKTRRFNSGVGFWSAGVLRSRCCPVLVPSYLRLGFVCVVSFCVVFLSVPDLTIHASSFFGIEETFDFVLLGRAMKHGPRFC